MSRHAGDWTQGCARLLIGVCADCGNHWYLPKDRCPRCGSGQQSAIQPSGEGRCLAVTLLHVTAEAGGAPLSLALVQLDEGPVVMGRVDDDLAPGDLACVHLLPSGTGTTLIPSFSKKAET